MGIMKLYADGVHIWTRELRTSGEIMKLPSGYKADFFQIEVQARVRVFSIEIASSAKELKQI